MQSLRQIGAGLLLGAFSVIMVLGGLTLALVQGGVTPNSITTTKTIENIPTGEIIATLEILPFSFTNTPRAFNLTATASYTPPATLVNCPPPAGWLPIMIQPNDTLDSLAQIYGSTSDTLQKSNCLLNHELIANSILYVPPQPISTRKPCGAPFGWNTYSVRAGDTLYGISLLYRVTWQELMQANCLDTSYIKTGQLLRVPNVQISTVVPAPTVTPIVAATETLESIPTLTDVIPTATDSPPPTETLPAATETPPATTAPSDTPIPSEPTTPTP